VDRPRKLWCLIHDTAGVLPPSPQVLADVLPPGCHPPCGARRGRHPWPGPPLRSGVPPKAPPRVPRPRPASGLILNNCTDYTVGVRRRTSHRELHPDSPGRPPESAAIRVSWTQKKGGLGQSPNPALQKNRGMKGSPNFAQFWNPPPKK